MREMEGSECECDGGLEVFAGMRSGLAQVCFEFGKGHFDGREVRTVSGQVVHPRRGLGLAF